MEGFNHFFTQRKKERITVPSKEDMEGFNHYRPPSSQDTVHHRRRYDVFLSFRGPDVRKSLVDHLFQSLTTAEFHVYLDTERLEKGKNIGISLKEAIRDSTVFIPIFSPDYARSAWCLEELWVISTCQETTIIPLFYNVEPYVVRYQTGIYAESLNELCAKERYSIEDMDKWKKALRDVSFLSGWSLSLTANGYEGKLVKYVVRDLLRTLKINLIDVAEHPVGLSDPMEKVTKLLEMDTNIHWLTVGIWGMGGMGKSTLSKAIYNNIQHRFEASCFVSDIRATAHESNKGLVYFQRQILDELVGINRKIYSVAHGIIQLKNHLASARVLVILDDVDDREQLDALAGDCYGPGSRIIITSRDKRILQLGKIDKIHTMKELSQQEGVQLFSWHAFLRACPENGYEHMTKKIVEACKGVPLSLEILGAHLYGERDMSIWSEAVEKIHKEVYQSLKISYDTLNNEEQQMFLDIACFFVNLFKNLTFYHDFWKASGCKTVRTSLQTLEQKSLIRVIDVDDSRSEIRMHDHLRDLGRQIVEDESPHDPSKRSRLWCLKDILSVLDHTEEMPQVRGLLLKELDLLQMDNLALMSNLRFLFCCDSYLERKITILPRDLRFLVMSSCRGIEELPALPERLVRLSVHECSKLKKLCNMSHMTKLETLQLYICSELMELPPLPECLIHIKVEGCPRLRKLSSMSHMIKLETLHVTCCGSLTQLPELKEKKSLRELTLSNSSLRELTLSNCNNLSELPPLPESLIHIKVKDCPKLQKLFMSHMIKLETIHVSGCASFAQLPELNCVQSLRELTLSDCDNLKELSLFPENLVHIKVERCCRLLNWMQSLKERGDINVELDSITGELTLSDCKNLKELPSFPECLLDISRRLQILSNISNTTETLNVYSCKSLVQLPELKSMQSVRKLTLYSCDKLEELPPLPDLVHIKVEGCDRLQNLSSISHMIKLETLHVYSCKSLVQLPELKWMQSLRELTLSSCDKLEELPPLPQSLVHIKVEGCDRLQKLSSISHMIKLETLHVYSCKSLVQLTELKWMQSLRELTLSSCDKLEELPRLPQSLVHIKVEGCYRLKKLSSMSHMSKLETFNVYSCQSLVQLPELKWMQSLRELTLSSCYNLKELSPLPESLVHIKVESCSRLQKLSSMSHMSKLETLHVSYCNSFAQLPELKWMQSLRELTLSRCWILEELSSFPESLEELPSFPESLVHIKVEDCYRVKTLPSMSPTSKLETLHVSKCKSLAQLPKLNCMQSLRELTLSSCDKLEELPSFPESHVHIKVDSCCRLKKLSSMSHISKLETLKVYSCESLSQLPELKWMQSLRELTLYYCKNLKELSPLPGSLLHIEVEDCPNLQKLSSMSHMVKLETLHVSWCGSLAQLPELNWMQSLREITLSKCDNLEELPPLPKGLLNLTLDSCRNLKKLAPLPEGLVNRIILGCHPLLTTTERRNFSMEQGESSVPPPEDPD